MNVLRSQQWQHIQLESGLGGLSLCGMSPERPDYRITMPFVEDFAND